MNALRADLIQALRGPVMLITLGTLMVLEYFEGVRFSRSWPILLIVFGVMKLLEKSGRPEISAPPQGGPAL